MIPQHKLYTKTIADTNIDTILTIQLSRITQLRLPFLSLFHNKSCIQVYEAFTQSSEYMTILSQVNINTNNMCIDYASLEHIHLYTLRYCIGHKFYHKPLFAYNSYLDNNSFTLGLDYVITSVCTQLWIAYILIMNSGPHLNGLIFAI